MSKFTKAQDTNSERAFFCQSLIPDFGEAGGTVTQRRVFGFGAHLRLTAIPVADPHH
ncbi:MAG: hypothetical protein R3F38_08570 [Gammaproteobacteria bacterium]